MNIPYFRRKSIGMKFFSFTIFLLLSFSGFAQIIPENITIIRDNWGVPHIYAPTDEEVAYGLAWATAEDDFKTVQETLMPIRGLLGRHKGIEGAALDFAVEFIDVHPIVEQKYDTDLTPKFRIIAEAYAAGANAYAEKHPEEVICKKLFPVNGKDIIKSYVLALTLLSSVQNDLGRIFSGTINLYENSPRGSNGLAVNAQKSTDGQTYLAINSHQPLEGPYAWYEAHLVSEEGLNILGATLTGGMHIFVGANENLGWTHTVNHPDFTDVYKLEMHRNEPLKYFLDGKWETLEVRKVNLKVKILGIPISVKRKIYRSKHGPVLKSKNGNFYAVRFPANQIITGAEQWYRMNKATNFEEFKKALRMLGVCSTNIIYGDRDGNIFYAGLGLFPKRNPKFNWKNVLPGHTSEAIWKPEFHTFEEIAKIENPQSGYVFNSNNTPFNATAPSDNLKAENFNSTFGYMTGDNNRSRRFNRLLEASGKISYEDFKRIKYDGKWDTPLHNFSFKNIENLLHLQPKKYPKLAESIQILNNWNRSTGVENIGAALFSLTVFYMQADLSKRGIFPDAFELTEPYMVKMLTKAQKHLKKHFKTVRIPLGSLQQHIRGNKKIPVWGTQDVITAMYGQPIKNGRFKIFAGESYISLVRFSEEGVKLETVSPYGASNDPKSPHYDDQMDLYVAKKLKKMSLKKEEVLKNSKHVYHPD